MTRALPIGLRLALAACLAGSIAMPAAGQALVERPDTGPIWAQNSYDAGPAGPDHVLSFAIPETDAWAFVATCDAGTTGPEIPVMIAVDFGNADDGDVVDVAFDMAGFSAVFDGEVFIENEEFAGVRVQIGLEDRFWSELPGDGSVSFGTADDAMITVPVQGIAAPLARFLTLCDQTFRSAQAGAMPDIIGPFTYLCEDGVRFTAQFDNSRSYSVAILSMGGSTANLIQVPSGSGALYSNGTVEMHTKGDEALMISNNETIRCRQEN